MNAEYAINSIFHIAKADFLQRIRSYYFLIALGVCVFIMYSFVPAPDAGYTMVSLGNYRGFYNSAWIGSMVARCVPFFALISFYLINTAVKRDIDTGVGQIIATSRITKMQYLTGKLISNFMVLMIILLVIAVMTVIMFILRGETSQVDLGKLLLPLLILTFPAMFIIAALSLFFDSLSGFSRGFLNIAYFFLWVFLVSSSLWSPATDIFGVNTCMLDIKKAIAAAHSDWNGLNGTGILIIDSLSQCKVFIWEGMNWTPWIFFQRIFWMILAFGLVFLASLRFNRFDTRETKEKKQRTLWFLKKIDKPTEDKKNPLRINYHKLPSATPRFNFLYLVRAELQLMFRGHSGVWLILSAGLFIASVFTPLDFAHKFILPLLWFFQIFILSDLGSRELTNRCNGYIFSAAFPLQRQLPATLSAGTLIMLGLALPMLVREIFAGNMYGAYGILVGAFFIPAFAVCSGIMTGGSKLFEVIFTMMVYGILNGVPWFDFLGAIKESREPGIAHYFLAISLVLTAFSFLGRKKQIWSG